MLQVCRQQRLKGFRMRQSKVSNLAKAARVVGFKKKQGGFIGSIFAPVAGKLIGGLLGGGSDGGSTPVQTADPFASQRGQYQGQLQQLMQGNFTPSDPSYQFRMNQGLEGVQRQAAAGGMLNSGNTLAALSNYGQQTASQEYSNQFNRLATLSGATTGSPSTAAQMQQQQMAGGAAFGQQIGGLLGDAAGKWRKRVPGIWNRGPGQQSSGGSQGKSENGDN